MNKNCPFGRSYDNKHSTCRSCTISCKEKLSGRLKQHKSKYGNSKTVVDGICFDSKKEAARYQQLRMMERAGLITDLRLQQRFELIPKQEGERPAHYTCDFQYRSGAETVVEDVKSQATKTRDYVLRRKLMKLVHGIKIVEV